MNNKASGSIILPAGTPQKRAYRQVARAEQSEAASHRILTECGRLMRSVSGLGDITLEVVAARSGTTVRTVLRHFGSREGLIEATLTELHRSIGAHREVDSAGGVDRALGALLANYEAIGDMAIRGLEHEYAYATLRDAYARARVSHRAWLEKAFADRLNALEASEREQRLTELYAATDLYVWKLLRRDLGVGAEATLATMRNVVLGILERKQHPAPTAVE